MVNVNVCATAFYSEGNLAEAMNAFEQASFGARMSAFVQRIRVKTDHLGHQKTVKRLAKFSAKQHRFEAQELGGMVTVEEYFRRSMFALCMVSEHAAILILHFQNTRSLCTIQIFL
jgi:hypothetical protein